MNGINQSVELIKAKRERDGLRTQLEELTQRHSFLQRSLHLLDEQKGTGTKVCSLIVMLFAPLT